MIESSNNSQQGEPNIDIAETAGSALSEANIASETSNTKSKLHNLILEREENFDEDEDETSGKIESWGVYLNAPEKVLIGVFWDKEIAESFKNSMRDSPLLEKISNLSEKN